MIAGVGREGFGIRRRQPVGLRLQGQCLEIAIRTVIEFAFQPGRAIERTVGAKVVKRSCDGISRHWNASGGPAPPGGEIGPTKKPLSPLITPLK